MNKKSENTEAKILEAAHNVFVEKGMAGARMQEIADEAGINKALLHYYFRSKDKLFDAVLFNAVKQIIPDIKSAMLSSMKFEEKLEIFIDKYMDIIQQNPFLPLFLINEVNRDPDKLAARFSEFGVNTKFIFNLISREFDERGIVIPDIRHWVVTLLSMMIFPIAARPILEKVMFEDNTDEFQQFMSERKEFVKQFMRNSIQKL